MVEVRSSKIRVELKLVTGYQDWVKQKLRENIELYGGDWIVVQVTLTNIGLTPLNCSVREISIKETVGSSAIGWSYSDTIFKSVNPGSSVTVIDSRILPLGEGLMWVRFTIESEDGSKIEIEGRDGTTFEHAIYVYNRLRLLP